MELGPLNPSSSSPPRRQAQFQAAPAPAFHDGFDQLSSQEQKQCKDLLTLLAAKGRLFKHNPEGGLDPASALEAYRALRSGEGVIEDVVATTARMTKESKSHQDSFYQDFYAGFDTALDKAHNSVQTSVLGYATTPVSGFSDLLWVDTEASGVPGGEHLPHSGRGTVVVHSVDRAEQDKRRHYYELNQPEFQTVDRMLEEQRRQLGR